MQAPAHYWERSPVQPETPVQLLGIGSESTAGSQGQNARWALWDSPLLQSGTARLHLRGLASHPWLPRRAYRPPPIRHSEGESGDRRRARTDTVSTTSNCAPESAEKGGSEDRSRSPA